MHPQGAGTTCAQAPALRPGSRKSVRWEDSWTFAAGGALAQIPVMLLKSCATLDGLLCLSESQVPLG